jgi:hypothetical protein
MEAQFSPEAVRGGFGKISAFCDRVEVLHEATNPAGG